MVSQCAARFFDPVVDHSNHSHLIGARLSATIIVDDLE
jgi:hypothetical protein